MNKSLINKKYKILPLLILYKASLEVSYVLYIYPLFGYMGFSYKPDIMKLIETYFFLTFVLILFPTDMKKPSTIAINVLMLISVIPMMSIYALMDQPRVYYYTILFSFSLILVILEIIPSLKVTPTKSTNRFMFVMLSIMTIIVYIGLISFNGLPSFERLNLAKVYDYRATFTYGLSIMAYLVPWQGNILNMFFLILFFLRKNKKYMFWVVILQLILFLLTGNRTYLFQPIAVILMSKFIETDKFISFSVKGLILTIGVSLFAFFSLGNGMLASLFLRRALFIPAKLSFNYFDFFSTNQHMYLSHSIFEFLSDKPIYEMRTQELIGQLYLGGGWANTGIFGDAYMNFGYIGIVVYCILLGIILKIIDAFSDTRSKQVISGGILGIFMFNLTNTAFLTSLLTGGLLFFIVLLRMYNDKQSNFQE